MVKFFNSVLIRHTKMFGSKSQETDSNRVKIIFKWDIYFSTPEMKISNNDRASMPNNNFGTSKKIKQTFWHLISALPQLDEYINKNLYAIFFCFRIWAVPVKHHWYKTIFFLISTSFLVNLAKKIYQKKKNLIRIIKKIKQHYKWVENAFDF